jgi:hypothetical protein
VCDASDLMGRVLDVSKGRERLDALTVPSIQSEMAIVSGAV